MIELSNSIAQTISPGEAIIFDVVKLHTGNAECHRSNTSSVKMKAKGVYKVSFSGNISGATADTPVQIAMSLSGDILPESVMISTPSAANAVNNVAKDILVANCCGDYSRISIVNNGAVDVTIAAGSTLIVARKS